MYGQGKFKRIIRSRFAKRPPLTVNTEYPSKVLIQPGVRTPQPLAVQTRFAMEIEYTLGIIRIKDLFTDLSAAILNKFDLRSIIECPGGMSTVRLVFNYERLSGHLE